MHLLAVWIGLWVTSLFCAACPFIVSFLSRMLFGRLGCESSWLMKLNFAKSPEWLVNPHFTFRWVLYHAVSFCSPKEEKMAAWRNTAANLESTPRSYHLLLIGKRVQNPNPGFPGPVPSHCPTVLTHSSSQIVFKCFLSIWRLFSFTHFLLLYLLWLGHFFRLNFFWGVTFPIDWQKRISGKKKDYISVDFR